MKLSARSSLKFGLSAAAALALAFGAASPAFAADVPIGPTDIVGFENPDEADAGYNYYEWHISSNNDPNRPLDASVEFGTCEVTMLAHENPGSWVQVLKGYPIDARPTAPRFGDPSVYQALFDSISIEVVTGNVTIQVPMFEYPTGATVPNFTTVRSVVLTPGVYNLGSLELEDSRGWFGSGTYTVSQFFTQMEEYQSYGTWYEVLGVGFNGSEGAQVKSLSFSGDTYYFGTGNCAPVPTVNPTPPTTVQTAVK